MVLTKYILFSPSSHLNKCTEVSLSYLFTNLEKLERIKLAWLELYNIDDKLRDKKYVKELIIDTCPSLKPVELQRLLTVSNFRKNLRMVKIYNIDKYAGLRYSDFAFLHCPIILFPIATV